MALRRPVRIRRDERGATTILAAASMMASLGCLAFAVDMGSIYFETRRLQGVADAAAIAAAADLSSADGAAATAITDSRLPSPVDRQVELGTYRPDGSVAPEQRFAVSEADPNAARVRLETDARLFFGVAALGRGAVRISRTATAARTNLASFSIGSRLAALQGGIANALLSALTGSSVNLSAMDYNALLSSDIDLFAFSEALQTELDLQAASFDDALAAEITTGRALSALANGLDGAGSRAAGDAVRKLVSTAAANRPVQLDKLIDLGPIGAQDKAANGQRVAVNAFDLARTMLELSNGNRQVALDLGASIPGVTKTSVKLSVGDRPSNSPWIAVTDKGEPIVRTAQTRLYIEVEVLPAGSALGVASVRLPLYIELAEAEAKLSAIDCRRRAQGGATLLVRPSIGHASIADLFPNDISNHKAPLVEGPARIVSAPLVSVAGKARIDLTAQEWKSVSFTAADIAARRVKTVSSESLVQGIVTSLVQQLQLTVNVLGLGLGTGLVGPLVQNTLAPVAPALDGVINALTGMLGIHLGQADVRMNGVRCGVPALVA